MPTARTAQVITIPSTDTAFRSLVERIVVDAGAVPVELEGRLRRIFPRVIVRERKLSGEPRTWYVYRDGGWLASQTGEWWQQPSMPRLVLSSDGFVTEASATAAGLLGIDPASLGLYHLTDFVLPGTLEDANALFAVIQQGNELTATLLLRPTSGDVIAVDVHAARDGSGLVAILRLAGDVGQPDVPPEVAPAPTITTLPRTDVAFRGYVLAALDRMPEAAPDGLALRVRRLYPHASIATSDEGWVVTRDPASVGPDEAPWWLEPGLPEVRYDAMALIVAANEPAREFFGRDLVGHHWQEFVTPGSTDQVSIMLEILADVGAAESRFRMPRGDGTLIEFDSYTVVQGDDFVTVFRPAARPAPSGGAAA